MDNSSASPRALKGLVDGIEEKVGGSRDGYPVYFDPKGDAVDPAGEREFTSPAEMQDWIGSRPDRDVIFVVRYQDE